jgi:nicotinamidase-related amidase
MVEFAIEPGRTALINVDLQNIFVEGSPEGLATVDRINRVSAATLVTIGTLFDHVLTVDEVVRKIIAAGD